MRLKRPMRHNPPCAVARRRVLVEAGVLSPLFYQDDQISFFPAAPLGWSVGVRKIVRGKRGKRGKSVVFAWV